MKRENRMFFILGMLGLCAILGALAAAGRVRDPMVPVVLLAIGIFLIIGGWADRRERRKKGKRNS